MDPMYGMLILVIGPYPSLDWKADPQESPVELVASPGLNLNEVKESSVGPVRPKRCGKLQTVVSNGRFVWLHM